MAACESIPHWDHIKSISTDQDSEIFPHFHSNNLVSSSSSSSSASFSHSSSPSSLSSNSTYWSDVVNPDNNNGGSRSTKYNSHSDSMSSMNSESLSLCTEGLGFESFDDSNGDKEGNRDADEMRDSNSWMEMEGKKCGGGGQKGNFPPPISCIGRSGKPWVWFKSYRQDGRFILKEIRVPTQEFLQAFRENGRLRLQFIQSEEDEEEEDDDV